LGSAFVTAIPALRVFGAMIPLVTIGGVIVFQWMLPLGLDREFNLVVFTSGILNVAVGIVLASKLAVLGMAMTGVITQMYSLAAFELILRRAGLSPFSKILRRPAPTGAASTEPELVNQI
jgi:PST family polysaccharide transporter